MPILSVDLAIRNWSDLGVVYLEHRGAQIACEIINLNQWHDPAEGPPPVVELAVRLNTLCIERGAAVLMLDGPQAYQADEHAAAYSHMHNSAGSSPNDFGPNPVQSCGATITHDRFVTYCLALYEALARLGWQRLASLDRDSRRGSPRSGNPATGSESARQSTHPRKILVESYPNAAWKSLGIALPDRQSCRVSDLAEAWAALTAILPVTSNRPPNHNQMQALAGGLPGLAIASDLEGEKTTPPAEMVMWEPIQPSSTDNGPRQEYLPSQQSAKTRGRRSKPSNFPRS
jgi:hypothetical protein